MYNLGVFFKKWAFDEENKNRPYFARIFVYISGSYTAKMIAIACLVFSKITVQLKPHPHKFSLKTTHTCTNPQFLGINKHGLTTIFGMQIHDIQTYTLTRNDSISFPTCIDAHSNIKWSEFIPYLETPFFFIKPYTIICIVLVFVFHRMGKR